MRENRRCYAEKFEAVLAILAEPVAAGRLAVSRPDAGFYLWADVKGSDTAFARALFAEQQIKRLEYYGSLMEWHTRWTDNRRTLYHLTTFRNGVVKRLAESLSPRNAR